MAITYSERDVEDWLYANPDEAGMERWIARQMRLPSGILDLLGVAECGGLCVVELKVEAIKSGALTQAKRYAADIEKLPGSGRVSCMCIGFGETDNTVQFEADALGVSLHTFKPSFHVSESWGFRQETREEHVKAISGVAASIPYLRFLGVAQEAAEALMRQVPSVPTCYMPLVMGIASDLGPDCGEWQLFELARATKRNSDGES